MIEHDPVSRTVQGACPECGLGFSFVMLTAHPRRFRWLRRLGIRSTSDRQASAGRLERRAAALAGVRFPLYGLDRSWHGRRWVGGFGSSGDRVTQATLAHGDAWDDSVPLVRVETIPIDDDGPFVRASTAKGLAHTLFHETGDQTVEIRDTFRRSEATKLLE